MVAATGEGGAVIPRNGDFRVERLWFPEGEESGAIDDGSYLLSMADSQGAFVEWSSGGRRDRRRRRVIPGDIWFYPPGQSWWVRRESGKTCILLSLSAAWLHQVTRSPGELRPQTPLRDPLLAQMVRTLAATAAVPAPDPTTVLYHESLVTTLILHLLTRYGQTPGASSGAMPLSAARLRAISEYVSGNLANRISLTELAHLAGLSISQFSLRFRETTGQTPHQYVLAARVDRARELLVAGGHAPADVAVMTGFADQSHLTRHFRRLLGTTPGALQRQ